MSEEINDNDKKIDMRISSWIVKSICAISIIVLVIFWGISMLSNGVKYGYEKGIKEMQDSAIEAGVGKWVIIDDKNKAVEFVLTNAVSITEE